MSGPDRNPMRGQTPTFDHEAVDRAYERARGLIEITPAETLELINLGRRENGLPPLSMEGKVVQPGLFEE